MKFCKILSIIFILIIFISHGHPVCATPAYRYNTSLKLLKADSEYLYMLMKEDIEPGSYYSHFKGKRFLKLKLSSEKIYQTQIKKIKRWCHPDTTDKWHTETIVDSPFIRSRYEDYNSFNKYQPNPFHFDSNNNLIYKSIYSDSQLIYTVKKLQEKLSQYPFGHHHYSAKYFSNPRVKKTYWIKDYLLVKFIFANQPRSGLTYTAILPVSLNKLPTNRNKPEVINFLSNLKRIEGQFKQNKLDTAFALLRKTKRLSELLPDTKPKNSPYAATYREQLLQHRGINYYLQLGREKHAASIIKNNIKTDKFDFPVKWKGKNWKDPPALLAHIYGNLNHWDKVDKTIRKYPLRPPHKERLKGYATLARKYFRGEKNIDTGIQRSPHSHFLEIERLLYFYDYKNQRDFLRRVHKKCKQFISQYPDHPRTPEIWWYQTLIARELNKHGADLPLPRKSKCSNSIYPRLEQLLFEQVGRGDTVNLSRDLIMALASTSLLYRTGPGSLPLIYWWKQKNLYRNHPRHWKGKFHYWWLLGDLLAGYEREARWHFSQADDSPSKLRSKNIHKWLVLAGEINFQIQEKWPGPDLKSISYMARNIGKIDGNGPFLRLYSAAGSIYNSKYTWSALLDLHQLANLPEKQDVMGWSRETVREISRDFLSDIFSERIPSLPKRPPAHSVLKNFPNSQLFSSRPDELSVVSDSEGYQVKMTLLPPRNSSGEIKRYFSMKKKIFITLLDHHRMEMPVRMKKRNRKITASWRWSKKEYKNFINSGRGYNQDSPPKYFIALIPLNRERWWNVFQKEIFRNIKYQSPFGKTAGFKLISGKLTPEQLRK